MGIYICWQFLTHFCVEKIGLMDLTPNSRGEGGRGGGKVALIKLSRMASKDGSGFVKADCEGACPLRGIY